MVIALLGVAGAGKTTIAKAMEKYIANAVVIDGDELRAETNNLDISMQGREANMHLGFTRARALSDAGHTVFVAMQAPIKKIREQYLTDEDMQILVINNGENPKDKLGYNDNFDPDYSGVENEIVLQDFSPEWFNSVFIPHLDKR